MNKYLENDKNDFLDPFKNVFYGPKVMKKKFIDMPDKMIAIDKYKKWQFWATVSFQGSTTYFLKIRSKKYIVPLNADYIKEQCINYDETPFESFDDFVLFHKKDLMRYPQNTIDFFLECYYLSLKKRINKKAKYDTARLASEMLKPNENLVKSLNKIMRLYNPIDDEILDILKFDAVSIIAFFVFGGIAYIFKPLIAFLIYILYGIFWCIQNILLCIAELFTGENEGVADLYIDKLGSPLRIWQIGGWISGFIVVCILLYSIYQIIEIKFGDKLDKWFQD